MTRSRAFGSSVFLVSFQIPPSASQKRARAQSSSASLRVSAGPSKVLAWSAKGSRLAVSFPLNLILAWVPSQKGLFADFPQRQRVRRLRIS